MALNSSNTTSHFRPTSTPIFEFMFNCFRSGMGFSNVAALTIISVLILPVYVLILKVGREKRQQRQSTTTMSHFDFITHHVVVLELLNTVLFIFCFIGLLIDLIYLSVLGVYSFPFKLTGQMLFDILTCAERYLAVVHPVTYVSLKTTTGIRVRNFVIGCVWALSIASMGIISLIDELSLILLCSCTIGFCILLFTFCSISVLCVLIQPKPGGGSAERQLVDQSKLRAFYIIVFVLAMLFVRSASNFLIIVKVDSLELKENEKCGLWLSVFWFCLPSSLVSPLLFLHKEGKLAFCKKTLTRGKH